MRYIRKKEWAIPEREATPESVFWDRRKFLKGAAGLAAGGIMGGALLDEASSAEAPPDKTLDLYPAKRNPIFKLDRPLTEEKVSEKYNNFYEFGGTKAISWLAQRLQTRPWTVKVGGLVNKPREFDIDDLIRTMPLEERLYRFRCVEAWAMALPWTGFPFSALIKAVEPKSGAKYVKLTTFLNRKVALGQLRIWYPWPYVEALTIEEAMNDLAMLVTGVYGHPLPKQHGAPLRLVVPWKYGFKNVKSIVSIEFTDKRPRTFWEQAGPGEYGFWANINPKFDHPRWSQATERLLASGSRSSWEVRPTQLFNGYAKWVQALYPDMTNRKYFM